MCVKRNSTERECNAFDLKKESDDVEVQAVQTVKTSPMTPKKMRR